MIKHVGGKCVDLDHADCFTMMNEHSYAAFIGVLSNIYMKAHASSKFRHSPYDVAIIINESMMIAYKNQPDSSIKRLIAIVDRMEQPNNKINVGFFLADGSMFSKRAKIGLKHTVSQCWPINSGNYDKDIITINLPPNQLSAGENKVRYFEYNTIKDAIGKKAITFLDYNTPIDTTFKVLEKSKVHICYQGGTGWLSVAMGIPTIIIHPLNSPKTHKLTLKFKLFGQELGNINILDEQRLIHHVRFHPNEHHTHINNFKDTLNNILK